MAKHFFHGKRRGTLVALSAALCATLTLGMLAACGETTGSGNDDDDDDQTTVSATDTQLLKNGNFEFYGERDTELKDKRAFISSPTSWSFTSGSPSSITTSGIINTADEEWNQITASTYSLVPEGAVEEIGTNESSTSFTAKELTAEIAANAEANWDKASVYDRLLFYKYYGVDSADEFSKYDDYRYSIDYEDVQYLKSDFADKQQKIALHEGVDAAKSGSSVLMIHNKRESDDVLGTAQYYTSSTTITLEAGTAAEISVWVRTDELYHWFDAEHTTGDKQQILSKGGAYIGVINTVGGTTLPEMQVKNINTKGNWENYTFYVRANTYASTTFRLKLGLGQGTSSDNRYENVDGYAFFDDINVTKMKASDYASAVQNTAHYECDINSDPEEKIFDRDTQKAYTAFSLDLLSEAFKSLTADEIKAEFDVGLTKQDKDSSYIKDNRTDAKPEEKAEGETKPEEQSIAGVYTYQELKEMAAKNGYLENVFKSDFEGKFPFGADENARNATPVLMLLSTNGAAYTATVKGETGDGLFVLPKNSRKLVSFFVKTWNVPTGRSGAGITLVDGENTTSISPFDSKTVSPVTIDSTKEELTDIYQGWVQCFFIVSNDTDTPKSFYLNFTYGTTSVQGTDESNYSDGYAAFTDIKVMDLTKTQYSYASTGTYAQKISLTAYAQNNSKFDTSEAASDIKSGLATPSSFIGAVAGSNIFVADQDGPSKNPNVVPEGVYAGLLNRENAQNYMDAAKGENAPAWAAALDKIAGSETDPNAWWGKIFSENGGMNPGDREANQPLVIMNTNATATASYGFISRTMETTISANTSQRISLRVKVAKDTTAYVYLLDTSDDAIGLNAMLAPSVPKYTYWYDDEGNIVSRDPESKEFNKKTDILYYLEPNGLYTAAGATDGKYYANLGNYEKDEDGNLTTSDGVIAFYYKETDGQGQYYGYLDDNGQYSQPVEPLPTAAEMLRYDKSALNAKDYESVISVTGTEANQDKWVDVNFYIRTGSEAKTYRLEVWAGDRNNATDGFHGNGYVFFDSYNSGSISDYDNLRDGKTGTNTYNGFGAKDRLLEKLGADGTKDEKDVLGNLALYYTFTFYDSVDYLRHDREHEEVDYNRWENYTQSSNSEGIVWLKCFDEDGTLYGVEGSPANPSYSIYLDFTPIEVSVTPYEPEEEAEEPEEEEEETQSTTNIWLVLSSSILAIVTVLAVVSVIVRAILGKKRKSGAPVKAKKDKRAKIKPAAPAAPAEQPTPESKDDNDPYND